MVNPEQQGHEEVSQIITKIRKALEDAWLAGYEAGLRAGRGEDG